MRTTTLLLAVFFIAGLSIAQEKGDAEAVNKVLDKYLETEVARDMVAQSKLMTDDRVWIADIEGRRTNQRLNMQLQQAYMDEEKKLVPGIRYFIEDRDRIIKFYGNVAIVSYYRYTNIVLPASTPADIAKNYSAPVPPYALTLVLVQDRGEWKIAHTHVSPMATPSGR